MDLENLAKFISIKSISTDSAFKADVDQCAQWLTNYLETFCSEVEIIQTSGNPVIRAKVGNGDPIVCYGHYDVQPADISDGWTSEPFLMQERNGRIYGRGAQDNKGQLWYVIQAVKSLVEQGQLKQKVIFLIEGEEECGGFGLRDLLLKSGQEITEGSECALLTDSGSVSNQVECITLGLRGVFQITAAVHGPGYDLHSGEHGGLAPNPLFDAAMLIRSLESDNYGKIQGFLDGWIEPSEEDLRLCGDFDLSSSEYSSLIKLRKQLDSLPHSTMLNGLYPRIEVCGVQGGYTGEGYKNIIPSFAVVKIVARTAFNQSSQKSSDALVRYLQGLPLKGKLEITDVHVSGNPVKVDASHPWVQKLTETIRAVTGNPVIGRYGGGSIPIAEAFYQVGIQPLIFGFGLEEDQIHGPNESFSLEQMEKGFKVIRALLG